MKTLATTTTAEIAAMPADSVELRVLCAEAMGLEVVETMVHFIDGLFDRAHVIDGKVLPLPNPANSPADAYAAREWMRGKLSEDGLELSIDGFNGECIEVLLNSVDVMPSKHQESLCFYLEGTTENHATALALAEYGRRVACGEVVG